MLMFGQKFGAMLFGGAVVELIGDVGAGKTTLAKGIAAGLGVDEDVQSPSFTISRVYSAKNQLKLAHYDFYRLESAGIMEHELRESVGDAETVTLVEWAGVVDDVLPIDRLSISFQSPTEDTRQLEISASGFKMKQLIEKPA